MSNLPSATASTSESLLATALVSTSASTSSSLLPHLTFRGLDDELDRTTSDASEILIVEHADTLNNTTHLKRYICICEESLLYDGIDEISFTSSLTSLASSEQISIPEFPETEESDVKDDVSISEMSTIIIEKAKDSTSPLLILVQMQEIANDLVNVEEHTKRLKSLEEEMEYIKTTEWMYQPIESSIK